MSAVKHDAGKASMSLIPRESLEGVAAVLGFGSRKYAAHNWRGGMQWSRLIDAALRHLTAFNDGEDLDPESGLPHLDHAACCLAFLTTYQKQSLGTDDRHKAPVKPAVLPEEVPPLFRKGDRVMCKEGRATSPVNSTYDLESAVVYVVTQDVKSMSSGYSSGLHLDGKKEAFAPDRFYRVS